MINFTHASNRNTPAYWLSIAGVDILISYCTPVAVSYGSTRVRRNNDWGPTTGRHMNEARVKDWPVVEHEREFNTILEQQILAAIQDRVERRLSHEL